MGNYKYGVAVGLEKVYFAPVVQEDETGVAYDEPFQIGESISVKPSFEFSEGSLSADNHVIRDDAELESIKLQINTARFAPEIVSKLLGKKMDNKGGLISRSGDTPPEGALLYEITLDTGKRKRVCLYKGVFKDFAEEAQTKQKGAKNYQTPTIEFTAYRRDDGLLKYELSEETEAFDKATFDGWFDDVPEPGEIDE